MEEKANTGQVIIVLTEHLTFGTLLIPYMAEKSDDGTYQLIEQAFHASPEAISRMNEAEQQAIDIASHYTEKYLMGIYSREKTVSRFLRKLSEDPERVKNNIRPFIEKKMQEMLTLIRHHNLPLYQKQVGSKLLYAHHAYHVHPHDVEIRFTFLADETNFRYQLQCYYDGQPLSLSEQKPVIVLTSSPSALLLGMELYFFPHIESVRILPFTKKKKISVPASQIEKYIDNIVIPIARYHEITTQGLNIIEETYACEAVLSLEDTIYDEQMLRLSFRYGDQSFTPDTVTEMKKIIYRNDFGEIFFFRRDSDAEEEKLRMLTDSGLQRVSDVHFKLSPDAPEKTITEWISTYREMLQQSFLLTGNMGNTPYCLDEIRIEQPLDIIKETCGFAGIFKQIGVIGDSLASGEFESHDENGNIVYTDMYEYSWPAVLERITGTKYNNYSRGGMTAREYVQSWADANGFWQWNQAYIIALGNNDSFVFGHPLGSVKDVNADCPQDNDDTFFGNMGKIVSKLKTIEPNARIFVVTPQLRGEACDNDIRYIASELAKLCDMFEFTYLLDMTAHAPVYDAEMRKSFGLGFHPNPMGYYAYALTVGNYIDYIIRSNPQEFATIPFVGTLLKNKDYK